MIKLKRWGGPGFVFLLSVVFEVAPGIDSWWPAATVFAVAVLWAILIWKPWQCTQQQTQNNPENQRPAELTKSRPTAGFGGETPYEHLTSKGQSRRLTQMRAAMTEMTYAHGHIDSQGLMEAVRNGKAFHAEPCLLCGKPRFQRGGRYL